MLAVYRANPSLMLALCVWREARGECMEAKIGVVHVVRNRCATAPAQGFERTLEGNIEKPYAFSSFDRDDPNSVKFPHEDDPSWADARRAATSDAADPTDGAVFYHDSSLSGPPAAWGEVEKTATLGRLTFYRLPTKVSAAATIASAPVVRAEVKA